LTNDLLRRCRGMYNLGDPLYGKTNSSSWGRWEESRASAEKEKTQPASGRLEGGDFTGSRKVMRRFDSRGHSDSRTNPGEERRMPNNFDGKNKTAEFTGKNPFVRPATCKDASLETRVGTRDGDLLGTNDETQKTWKEGNKFLGWRKADWKAIVASMVRSHRGTGES